MSTYSVRLSVIIPVAGGRTQLLRLVLASLAVQDYPQELWEVIVVSDTSDTKDAERCWHTVLLERIPIRFIWSPKEQRDAGGSSRNFGAKIARNPFLIFLDSDVIVCPKTLTYYAEGFTNMPNRVIVGLYHWLRPMEVTLDDVKTRFQEIIEEQLPPLPLEKPKHNIQRDARQPFYEKTSPDIRHSGGYQSYLACLTGNIGIPRKIFWDLSIKGFREDLTYGVDGAFGMSLYRAGYTFSFDKRLIAGHLYHTRGQVDQADSDLTQRRLVQLFHSDDSWMGRSISKGG